MARSKPRSVIIIGGGCFGMSTALELSKNPSYAETKILLVDMFELPNEHGSSWDINRIVRADYANPLYASLADNALDLWQTTWGASGRYTESGLLLLGDSDSSYINESLALAKARGKHNRVQECSNRTEISRACRTGGCSGSRGYLNREAGWVDAQKSMTFAYAELIRMDRVEVIRGYVKNLLVKEMGDEKNKMINGVVLTNGRILSSELTIVATGPHSPMLLDMQGIATASAEVFAYVVLTEEEVEKLKGMPAIINLSKGWFIVPPNGQILKVARHGLGFSNKQSILHPLLPELREISVPVLTTEHEREIAEEGSQACKEALRELIP